MKLSLALWTAGAALIAGASAEVVELIPETFYDVVGKGRPALVEFYAPWCGHCKNLAPTYERLADAYLYARDKVNVVKVDADGEGKELGRKYGVKGFPTLKWFDAAGKEEAYEGPREFDDLSKFITEKTGLKPKEKPGPKSWVEIADIHNFDELVLDNTKDVMVAFTAPWCGHCKRMKPSYEEVAKAFRTEKDCLIVNVDADAQQNKPLGAKYGVASFPTLKFFPKDQKDEPIPYTGQRDTADFLKYLNDHCGTDRTLLGNLGAKFGRIPALDELAIQFLSASNSARDQLLKQTQTLASTAGKTAEHYVKAMSKIANGAEDYIVKELARLEKMQSKPSVSREKLDEIQLKANILAAFLAEKVEEAVETVEEAAEAVVGKAKEEL